LGNCSVILDGQNYATVLEIPVEMQYMYNVSTDDQMASSVSSISVIDADGNPVSDANV